MAEREARLPLNPDDLANLRQYLKEIRTAASLGKYLLEHEGLTQESATSTLHLIEAHLDRAGKLVGYSSAAMNERQELSAALRSAHVRARELENLIGAEQSIEALAAQLKFLNRKIQAWWSGELGMGWVSEVDFKPGGTVELKLGLKFDRLSWLSARPVTDLRIAEENLARLMAEGYQFTREDRDFHLIDNDENRMRLCSLVAQHLPTGQVHQFDHYRLVKSSGGHADPPTFLLTDVHLWVRDLKDLQNLPGQISND